MSQIILPAAMDDFAPKARIREAALRLYAEHGIKATTIRMVADTAGVSAGAVMHHFKSKERLIEAVQHSVVSQIREAVGTVSLDTAPHVIARERRHAFDTMIFENPAISGYLRRSLLEGGPESVALFKEAFDLVRHEMDAMVAANVARELPDPEVGLLLFRSLNLAHIIYGPIIEEVLGIDLAAPEALERFREATIDLLTRPLYNTDPAALDPA